MKDFWNFTWNICHFKYLWLFIVAVNIVWPLGWYFQTGRYITDALWFFVIILIAYIVGFVYWKWRLE